jgi:NAD(P)-dependent dehydrogenase (short-subunit alcohol dehydrogenase family)
MTPAYSSSREAGRSYRRAGIGAGITEVLAEAGQKVVITDLDAAGPRGRPKP